MSWFVPFAWAQVNLVPNPGFDEWENCPMGQANLAGYVKDWYVTLSSPDYYNACHPTFLGVPYNSSGYQPSRSGHAYMAASTYSYNNFVGSPMEFFGVRLKEPLKAGKRYCVEFYVNPANYAGYFVDCFGAYFSQTPLDVQGSNFVNGTYRPQVENQPGNVVTDTAAWTPITGSFTAQGGEQYLSLGCYKTLLGVDTVKNAENPFTTVLSNSTYYFFEDVSVVFCDQSTVDDITVPDIITPNTDGINDQLVINAPENYASQPKLTVYTRWGNVIYRTGEVFSQPWNATGPNGQPVPTGVYYYVIQDGDGSKSGFIQVSY